MTSAEHYGRVPSTGELIGPYETEEELAAEIAAAEEESRSIVAGFIRDRKRPVTSLSEAAAYLLADGDLAVPCSRYGRTSSDCAPVAWTLAEIVADASGEPVKVSDLEYAMGLVVNDHDDVAEVLWSHAPEIAADLDIPRFIRDEYLS